MCTSPGCTDARSGGAAALVRRRRRATPSLRVSPSEMRLSEIALVALTDLPAYRDGYRACMRDVSSQHDVTSWAAPGGGVCDLCFSLRLPLEHGSAFEQGSAIGQTVSAHSNKQAARISTGRHPPPTRSSRSPARGVGGCAARPTTLILHLSADEPPLLECAGPSARNRPNRLRLRRTPPHHQTNRPRPRHSRGRTLPS